MCGILCVLSAQCGQNDLTVDKVKDQAWKCLHHRGPDECGVIKKSGQFILCHQRLSIVGVKHGNQPISLPNTSNTSKNQLMTHLSTNGEIYNYQQLYKQLEMPPNRRKTQSDSEVLLHLYDKYVANNKSDNNNIKYMINELDGMFAFVILQEINDSSCVLLAARDPFGIKPLFIGYNDHSNQIWFASEVKAIANKCNFIEQFPAGHFIHYKYNDKINFNNKNGDFRLRCERFFYPKWPIGREIALRNKFIIDQRSGQHNGSTNIDYSDDFMIDCVIIFFAKSEPFLK